MSLPAADPEEVGLDPRRLALAGRHTRRAVDDGACTAAVVLVARRGRTAHAAAFGCLRPDGPPCRVESVFDLASLTKPVVAATLLTLVEDGSVSLGQTVGELLPEAQGAPCASVSVRHLATHVSGLPAWKPLYQAGGGRAAMLAEVLRTPLLHPPGMHYAYSDLGYILLGEVLAMAGGAPLDRLVHERVLGPLGMDATGYRPAEDLRPRIAATANCPMRPGRTLVGEAHDANAHAYGGVAGHAGLFGTGPDLAAFAAAMVCGGGEGPRLLGIPTLRLAQTNQAPPGVGGHSIGWFTHPNGMLPRGDILDDGTFGHTGFTGTMIVCSPPLGLAVVLLTNRVFSPADNGAIQRLRRQVLNAVASAVVA